MGNSPTDKPVSPIGPKNTDNVMRPEQEPIQQQRQETPQQSEPPADLPKLSREMNTTLQKIFQRMDNALQSFKLPGTNTIVHDRREARDPEKHDKKGDSIRDEAGMSLEALVQQRGKSGVKSKEYENFFADPAARVKQATPGAIQEKLAKLLSRFENVLLKRFEGGEAVAKEGKEGEPSFLKKTADQWRDFFGHFMNRTVKRSVALEEVDGMVYRGLIQKDARATVISDLALRNGQIEKFARFRLEAAQSIVDRLNQLEPGANLTADDLRNLTLDELEYLAIKNAEPEATWTQAPTLGKFLKTATAEEKVAGDLGIRKSKSKREKDEEQAEEPLPQFIPWYQTLFQKRPGGPVRWFVVVTYIVVAVLVTFAFWTLFRP